MPHGVLIIRFPDGTAELFDGGQPALGDSITRRGGDWRVTRVHESGGSVKVTVVATDVVRDDSWPAPYEFFRP